MNKLLVEYIIDDISKEIYHFVLSGDTWIYSGIYYVHRNDRDDVWGDQWGDKYKIKQREELDELSISLGYAHYDEMGDECGEWMDDRVDEIYNAYNPVCQKTRHGKPYYSGCYWGYGLRDKQYDPKMSEEDLIKYITRQVSKVKIKLDNVRS